MKKFLGMVVVLFTTLAMGYGQATSVNGGSIQGTITDQTGAVVPGANVTITGTDTGSLKVLTTDSAGFYSIGPLNPGKYIVSVTLPGFQKLSVTTMVRTGTATNGNYKMTVGESSQTIEVNAGQLQINTDQPGVSDVMTKEQIDTLPVNGRNFLDLAQIQPGVILQSGDTFDPTKAGYSAISVSGQSGRTTRILLDGQDITDENVGTTIVNVPSGAIDEFQLNRSTQDVSGEVTSTGQVLVATRSGTNAFHGNLFYDFQDHSVGFARTTNGFDSPFQRNQFGGGVGGPIIKDKLFFFGDIERIKQDSQGAANTSPTFASIQAQYPTVPATFKDTFSTGRLDYNGPFGGHYFVRGFYEANADSSNFNQLYSLYENRDNVPGLVGGVDFTSGHFTHSFRGGYEKFHNLITDGTAGVTSIYNPLPGVTLFDSQDGFYAGPNYLAPQGTFQSDKQLRYDGTWTHGSHTVKYGASLNRILGGGFAEFYGATVFAQFSAGSALANCGGVAGAAPCPGDPLNGYSALNYTLGNGNGIFTEKPAFGLPGGGLEDWRSAFYIADNWKIVPSFSLTAGFRYSIDTDRANQDLPPIPCSSVTGPTAPCSGSANLLDQFAPGQTGFGDRVHQPYGNFGPQVGFAFSPGDHKMSLRAGIGIFYENDIFNNTSNARSLVIDSSGPFFNVTAVCGNAGTSVALPGGGSVTSVNGVPLSTVCAEPLAQSAPQIQQVQAEYQAATKANNSSSNPGFIGGTLSTGATGTMYAAPYRTPYSIQYNAGVQREIAKGTIVTADYVHNSTLKVPIIIDENHLGAARTLDVAAAQAAISATTASAGCAGGYSSAAITCAIAAGKTIVDFAHNGLDSGATYLGGYPASIAGLPQPYAAFPGLNPKVGYGYFIVPEGRSGYDALQLTAKQVRSHPAPGIQSANFQISYSLSRIVTASKINNNTGGTDQFFSSYVWDQDNPNLNLGRATLDHTNELSFGGSFLLKYGPQLGIIGHFFSAPPSTLSLDNTSGQPGEIFRTDLDGDGQTGDLLPGTVPGDYMHRVKPNNLNKFITSYNTTHAGQFTPAGQALVTAGLFTPGQLYAANGVQQAIATVPTPTAIPNSMFRALDVNVSYPIHLSRIREGLTIEPAVAMYNVFNLANFGTLSGTLANVNTAGGPTGASLQNQLNGPNTYTIQNQTRVQRASGTFSQGAPRTTEFQLKLNF